MASTEGSGDTVTIEKKLYDTLYTHYRHCPRVNKEERTDGKRGGKKQGNKKGKWTNPKEGNEQCSEECGEECSEECIEGSSGESSCESNDESSDQMGNEKQRDRGSRYILSSLRKKNKWRAWQDKLFQEEKQYQSIIDNLASKVVVKTKEISETCHNQDLITIGKGLALRYTESVKDKRLHAAISRFLLLILSSYCLFLFENDISEAEIDCILGYITSVGYYRRKKLIRQASLINKLIDELVVKEHWYVSRATELFFLLSIPASYFVDIPVINFATLRRKIAKRYGNENFDDCMEVYYSIPTILKNYLDHFNPGNDISLDKIFKDLGYKKSHPLQKKSLEASSNSMCFFGATELAFASLSWTKPQLILRASKRQRPHDEYHARKQRVRRSHGDTDGEDSIAERLGQRQPLPPFLPSPPATDDRDSTSHSMRSSAIDTHQHHSIPSSGKIHDTLHQAASDIAIAPRTDGEMQIDLHDSMSEGGGLQDDLISENTGVSEPSNNLSELLISSESRTATQSFDVDSRCSWVNEDRTPPPSAVMEHHWEAGTWNLLELSQW